ncbi:MAG: 2-hydroxyglutaryl-CoA dehydratase [Lachnospiraceae bacterium]|nr:2-hydroxyglutaryl-CoA dehydratase [Lachnospiraceae bacterium]
MKRIGLDIGSTTIKCVVLDEKNNIVYSDYKRHLSRIAYMTQCLLDAISEQFPGEDMSLVISGSAGMGIATDMNIPFVQEVYATRTSVKNLIPETDTVIELGGEDAKILFLSNGLEVRMNGSCAGGTGAFIDQMSTLMNITPDELNVYAKEHEKIYTIASRCGVFAKTDIQPLINQGARKEDIAASILYAVVNQTIGGLAQGREIEGNVLYLGGPLTFLSELRRSFNKVLNLHGTCPENSLYYVALGAAMSPTDTSFVLKELSERISNYTSSAGYTSCTPLFESDADYEEFCSRHEHDSDNIHEITEPADKMFLGIDAGSTTVKAVLCDENGNIFNPSYQSNSGNPVPLIKSYLEDLYKKWPDINICSAAVTGYGEDIIRNAFHVDYGIVETIAHYTAAKKFKPDVDFIIDIGGQDIKCFKIHNGAIDNIFLNEACSSGCGSFLQTFAGALGYEMNDFAKMAVKADMPVDLGSRCTVFMNSSVKQAQKDGASIGNISAGLSISVVKNALYKVIRCANTDSLGKNIVVQGGTFLNNSVLRAFEQEIGRDVIRPHISGLMGAYGAALYGMNKCNKNGTSKIANANDLKSFTHEVKVLQCNGCNNHCRLTVNTFDNGRKFIAGNRCEKPLNLPKSSVHHDLYEYKNQLLMKYRTNNIIPGRPTIGIPMALNMYELLPFWHTMFDSLGFNVVVSPVSNRQLYLDGQQTIPSDTVCFPAKLVHGHIDALTKTEVDAIFYPCMSYNLDEGLGDNHYNCPVVAYYPIVIDANVKKIKEKVFIDDFVGIHMPKSFYKNFRKTLAKYGYNFSTSAIKKAADKSYKEYAAHMNAIREKADEYLQIARSENKPVIVLAGRPYHIDPEVNHSINKMICNLGAIVLTEDSISWHEKKFPTNVLNQWTYHSRLYAAAKYVSKNRDKDLNINLVQLVSFGCGVDAVTTDEARSIIESSGKIYTQIKIDEVSNMGAIKIRLRSLFSAAGIV